MSDTLDTTSSTTTDALSDELRARDAAWSAAASSGAPLEEVLEYWSDDAVVVPPGMDEVRGKDALRAYVTASTAIPGFRISWETGDIELSDDGSMAWIRGTNRVEMTGEDGTPVVMEGRVLTTWRREGGTWRCTNDIWNAGG
ncbi:ketosteroid isomerase-like protein [Nocardioides marinisabuli]|uniref:Ketosteroid isomerase-like protein n=1 Tax=Nocardioides marinisabuli TaxID=419476 RepID=A0A7Y9F059_9ACTN|nr:DUF4440 domain-containing protein [Nocardioides marinisabuli]NYD56941.1 ketosteroid isomerase-like protein [Nocardioides marinisabuli]